jgi:hypothetical protein
MSWHFSQALVEAYSADTCSAGVPSAPSSSTPTRGTYWSPGKTMDASKPSRSGMTFKPLTDDRGEAVLMSYLEDFPVRTFHAPEKVQESTGREADSGETWQGSFVKWDRDSSSWKTHQFSLLGGLESFSETWPRWGMMRDGACWELTMPVVLSGVSDCGLLPSPLAQDWRGGTTTPHSKTGKSRDDQLRHWVKIHHGLTYPIPEHSETLIGWPAKWTDCAVSATDKFQQWQRSHGIS